MLQRCDVAFMMVWYADAVPGINALLQLACIENALCPPAVQANSMLFDARSDIGRKVFEAIVWKVR
ncbi:hypothetical protein AD929_02265 [Gluconobacter potus]|uniref:Uncharacterized protein n=1 Tax=Gluconobacter potus TaxID=2724927 RepID=A0A149QZ06_9PROT|nr:hypothetical protein AD929_02265 [Gluconobacter potus]